MSFVQIVRLLVRFSAYIGLTALCLAFLVFWFTKDAKQEYQSHTLLNTGLISGYNIESNNGERIDYAYTNNEMENLINLATSFETQKELSARLLAHMLLERSKGENPILKENQEVLETSLENIEVEINGRDSLKSVQQKIIELREADKQNAIYELTYSKNLFFGLDQLENIKVVREGNSDMIRMEYASIDPYMSQITLSFLTDIFMESQLDTKEGQTESVILFFEEATANTLAKLKQAEDDLLNFRVKNQIINYYEQTRFISGNKEELDKQFQDQLKIKAGAESAIKRIELEIDDKSVLPVIQERIADNQKKIAEFTNELTEITITNDSLLDRQTLVKKRDLEAKIKNLKAEMIESTKSVIAVTQTSDGVPTSNLLTQWLNNVISREESSAKLEVMKIRQKEYEAIYDRFAPLGSTLTRLEREIDVAEREYLENLRSYNQARLDQYNMLMSSNLKVIDKPFYPAQPEKSKTSMMVILAFMVGLVVPSSAVIGMEFMDSSLKSPKNTAEKTGLRIAGLMPKLPKDVEKSNIDFSTITDQAMNLFVQELRIAGKKATGKKNVVVFSIQNQEGKTTLIENAQKFIGKHFDENEFNWIELPSILNNPYGHDKVKNGDIHILVTKADRKWTEADQHALKVYKKYVGQKPVVFLNGVRTDIMEDVIGEVPKKRSWLRRKVKAVLS